MNERPQPTVKPGVLTREMAAELTRAAMLGERHGRVTATPPVLLHDSASGILLTADTEEEQTVVVRSGRREEVKRVRRPVEPVRFVEGRYVRRGVNRVFVRYPEPWPIRLFHRQKQGSFAFGFRRDADGNLPVIPAGGVMVPTYTRYDGDFPNSATISDFMPASAVHGVLSAPLGNSPSDILVPVASYDGYPTTPFLISVEGETMRAYADLGTPTWTVERAYGADSSQPANVITAHEAGKAVLWLDEYHDTLVFTRQNAGEYLVAVYYDPEEAAYAPGDPREDYLGLEMVVNGGTAVEIGRVFLRVSGNIHGFGWAVQEFEDGDTLKFQVRNRYSYSYGPFLDGLTVKLVPTNG